MAPHPLTVHQFTPVSNLPACDFCPAGRGSAARYDFRTRDGRWANGCERHHIQHRMHPTLGTGKGQRLVLPDEPTPTIDD
jgi:hypothetical protein